MPSKRTPPHPRCAFVCPRCGVTFTRPPSQVKNPEAVHCSAACASAARRVMAEQACERCGHVFRAIPSEIARADRKFCSAACYHDSRRGIPLPRRTDGVRVENGYRFIYLPEHPRAKSNGYVREHILVAERMLGRPLADDEIVHHRNHVRDDNRPENLEVLASQSDHMSLHMRLFHADHPQFRHLSKDAKRSYKSVRQPDPG
jgi:ferredoxin